MFNATTSMKSSSDRGGNAGFRDSIHSGSLALNLLNSQSSMRQRLDIEDHDGSKQTLSNPSKTDNMKKRHSSLIIRIVPQDLLNEMACSWRVFSCGTLKTAADDSFVLDDSHDECGFEIGEDGYEISEQGSLLQQNYGMSRV
jgi:hypothetical protein